MEKSPRNREIFAGFNGKRIYVLKICSTFLESRTFGSFINIQRGSSDKDSS